jgi:hypothetical protein
MTYFIGTQPSETGDLSSRFFYAIRRTDDGLLYLIKVDQLKDDDEVIINNPGLTENDFTEFEYGVDFFDGRLEEDHSRPHSRPQSESLPLNKALMDWLKDHSVMAKKGQPGRSQGRLLVLHQR